MFGSHVNDNLSPFRITLTAHALMGRKGASEYGGHVILPDSVLQSLLARDIQYPMLFKLLVEDTKKAVYCGVTEFTAPPNVIYLPQWMMDQLEIVEGQQVQLFNVMLQLGTYLLIRPHTYKFVEKYSDPKTILEQHITKYATLTRGTTIKICVGGEETMEHSFTDQKITAPSSLQVTIVDNDFEASVVVAVVGTHNTLRIGPLWVFREPSRS